MDGRGDCQASRRLRRDRGRAAALLFVAVRESVQAEIGEVAAVAEQSSASTEEVSASAQESAAAAQQVAASAQELLRSADSLGELVARFTLSD